VLGSALAGATGLRVGDKVDIGTKAFTVSRVLEPAGSLDDHSVFISLSDLQAALESGDRVNVIALRQPTQEDIVAMSDRVRDLSPELKIITAHRVRRAVDDITATVKRYALGFIALVLVVSGLAVANQASLDARERSVELATLLAVGADPRTILYLLCGKTALLAAVGGTIGYFLGGALASAATLRYLTVPFAWIPVLAPAAIILSIGFGLIFTLVPARRAAALDPALVFRGP